MSFRRRAAPPATAPPAGVTVAACGARVVSSGIRGLNDQLGGGIPQGALTILIEDGATALHAHILAAFAADARAHAHPLAIALPTLPAADFLSALQQPAPVPHTTERTDDAPQLTIAWRYARDAPQRHVDRATPATPRKDAPVSALGFPELGVAALIEGVRAHCARASRERAVARVVVGSLGALWCWDDIKGGMHAVLAALRKAAVDARAALVVTVPAGTSPVDVAMTADTVLVMRELPKSTAPRSPIGIAVLFKSMHCTPGRWLGVRGDAYTYRIARRGPVFERASLEPVDEKDDGGRPGSMTAAENGNARMAAACSSGRGNGAFDF